MSRHVRLHSRCLDTWGYIVRGVVSAFVIEKRKSSSFMSLLFTSEDKCGVSYLFQRDRSITDKVLKGKVNFSLLYYVDFRRRSFGEAQALCPSLSLQMLTAVSKFMQLCSSIIGLVLRRWSEIRIPSLLYHVLSTEVRAKSLKSLRCLSPQIACLKRLNSSVCRCPPRKRVIIHSSQKRPTQQAAFLRGFHTSPPFC